MGVRFPDEVRQDIRYAWRTLRRSPGFTTVAVTTLALGIGATTAIFSVVNAVLLRPLPYPGSDRLVRFLEHRPPDAGPAVDPLARIFTSDMAAFRVQATTLSHVGTYALGSAIVTGRGEPIRLEVTRVSPAVFAMLGVPARLGRTFEQREETPGADEVIVLSHGTWRRYFGGSLDILGERLTLDGRTFSVVGVMPEGFQFPDPETQVWTPYTLGAARFRVSPIARVADGVSFATASAQVTAILRELQARSAPATATPSTFELERIQEGLIAPVRSALVALAWAVGVVLLIACVNVANLLLARTAARGREIAVRLALGAGRARLARQLLTESVVLAMAGGAAGTLLAFGGLQLLRTLGTGLSRRDLAAGISIPRLDEVGIDLPALAFTLGIAVTAGVLFGLAPIVRSSRWRQIERLREGAASADSGFNLFRRHRLQGVLVVAEISMAMLVLVGGGLLMYSFVNLTHVDPGYDPAHLLTFTVSSVGTPTPPTFNDDVVARMKGLPDVRAAGYAELMPMVRFRSGGPLRPAQPIPGIKPPPRLDVRVVSWDFLTAMGMRIIEGRGFAETDGASAPRVLLINRTLARSGYLGPAPVGTRVYPTALNVQWAVIGIVDDVRQYGLDQEPDAQIFIDNRQLPMGNPNPYFAVRAVGDPLALVPTIRTLAKQVNPGAMIENVATMEQVLSNSVGRPRLYAVLIGLFAAIAVGLSAIGIYGVLAYSVAQRTREIGIRMALGAAEFDVLGLVLGQSLVLTAIGIALGIAGAAASGRYLETLLFGLTPLDLPTFVVVSVLFLLIALLAAYIPARRATRIDPLVALRCE